MPLSVACHGLGGQCVILHVMPMGRLPEDKEMLKPLKWDSSDGCLRVLDQRRLPATESWEECRTAAEVVEAIRDMQVRGAPAIGIAGAWGAVLSVRAHFSKSGRWREAVAEELGRLAQARPTAVNLQQAVDRMSRIIASEEATPERLEAEAAAIEAEDIAANQRIGELGAALLPQGSRILTHCNTGALATGGHGTAAGIIRTAFAQGRLASVIATETRPWLQGMRLTTWELAQEGIPVSLIVDSAAAALMAAGEVDAVIVGADRITRNGDVANKIGTYALALAAAAHDLPFIVAAPATTVDPKLGSGDEIPIEEREGQELWRAAGLDQAPQGVRTRNPAFDITPARLITAVVTEYGVSRVAAGETPYITPPEPAERA